MAETFEDILFANFDPIDEDEIIDDHLNEEYDFSCVGGPFKYLDPADVLKEMDFTGYLQMKSDYLDENYVRYAGEYWKSEDFEDAEGMFEEQENDEDEDE
jgi:hypothetical protein